MSCFSCMPPPASQKPRKIYNILVPDVFPIKCPDDDEPVPHSIQRKIGKLQEYVQRNPERIGKVSRRLKRRIQRSLYEREIGYTRIAVAAFAQLLEGSLASDSSYTLTYFSKELIQDPDAVIITLLNESSPAFQALGAELLTAYIRVQTEIDNQVASVEQLMGAIVRIMLGRAPKGVDGKSIKGKGATSDAIKIECILAIKEYIVFCHRLKVVPELLEDIEFRIQFNLVMAEILTRCHVQEIILVNVDLSSDDVQKLINQPHPGDSLEGSTIPSDEGRQSGISSLALSALRCFKPFLQDISIVYRVLQTLLSYLDKDSKWEQDQYVESLLGLIKHACGDQTFPLFTSLMRHCSDIGLSPRQRLVIIKHAVPRGSPYSLSAISLALTELPKALLAAGVTPGISLTQDQKELKDQALSAVQHLAGEVGDAAQLCDALSGSLRQYVSNSRSQSSAELGLDYVLVALRTIPNLKEQGRLFPSRSFPATLIHQLSLFLSDTTTAPFQLALEALGLVLVAVQAGGSPPPLDERSALSILATARSLASAEGSGPKALEVASRLTACVALSTYSNIHLHLAKSALSIRTATLQDPSWSDVRVAAGLLLTNTVLVQLDKAVQGSGAVTELCTSGLDSLQIGVVIKSGVVVATEDTLTKVPGEATSKIVEAARASSSSWASALSTSLLKGGSLSQAYSSNLPLMLSEPLGTAPSFTALSTATSAEVKVDFLPERVAASSWGERKGSMRRDNVNLERVLELLEDVKDDGITCNDAVIATSKQGAALAPSASIKEVLEMIGKMPPRAKCAVDEEPIGKIIIMSM